MSQILVLHFTHPEGYPPALNAINCLSEKVDSLKVITTDTLPTKWNYKENVEFEFIEGEHDRFAFVKKSKTVKVKRYFEFAKKIRKSIKNEEPDLIVIYDNVPFLLYLLATFLLKKKHKLWYHNHDIYPLSQYPKYSILWFSFYAIQNFFNRIDYFSLPSMERKKMFPMDRFKGQFYFIPNYPSKKIIGFNKERALNWVNNKYLKLIYPGSPSIKNGFEELIEVMQAKVNSKIITLTIVGETDERYKNELVEFARLKGVEKQLFFESRVPYTKMPEFLRSYHIGWAMYKPQDMRTATVGTASNKIYEFLANAMPIMVFDNKHHREHLSNTAATFFTDLSSSSIEEILNRIDLKYESLSLAAYSEYDKKYQFEQNFNKVRDDILN